MIYQPMPEMKLCTKCQLSYPATTYYFHRDKTRRDSLFPQCKNCTRATDRANRAHKDAYLQEWRRGHPERVAALKRRDRAKNHARIRRQQTEWENRNRVHVRRLQRNGAAKRRKENPEHERNKQRDWRAKNPDAVRAHNHKRRARLKALPVSHTKTDIIRQYEAQMGLCWWCGKPVNGEYHVDHRIPIARGGTNGPENICISCPHCNQSKGDKMPWEWSDRLL